MKTMEFIALLRVVCGKFDEFLKLKHKKTIFDLLEENFKILGLLKEGAEYINLTDLRALLLSHRINYQILIYLIVENM